MLSFLSIMLSIQFKSTQSAEPNIAHARVAELTEIRNGYRRRDVLVEEVLELREKLKNVREYDTAMADLQEELLKANMSAGLIEVEGRESSLPLMTVF